MIPVVPAAPAEPSLPDTTPPDATGPDATAPESAPPDALALRDVAPIRLGLAALAALALTAAAAGLTPMPQTTRLPGGAMAGGALVLLTLGLLVYAVVRRAQARARSVHHAAALVDAAALAALVVVFGSPALAILPLLAIVPLAALHPRPARIALGWTAPAFLLASEAHVRVRPLNAPALPEVWLGAGGLVLVGGLALWQAARQRAQVLALRDRIAARDVGAADTATVTAVASSTNADLARPRTLQPLEDAVAAWRWEERARARALAAHERERGGRLEQLEADVEALHTRATDAARDAELMHEVLAQSARTVTEGARTARAARAAGDLAAASADLSAESARRLSLTAHAARERIDQATRTLRLVSEDVSLVAHEVRTLVPLTDEVGSVVHVLERLVRQTTQLALNAAIEAQRAGPFGLGFHVVADEMQRLAGETAATAAAIAGAVSTARDRVHDLTGRLERTVQATADVDDVALATRRAVETVLEEVGQLLDRTDASMRQARSQADAATAALLALDGLEERTQRAALEARRTALSLATHATDLHAARHAVEQLRESAAPTAPAVVRVTPTRRDADDRRGAAAPPTARQERRDVA